MDNVEECRKQMEDLLVSSEPPSAKMTEVFIQPECLDAIDEPLTNYLLPVHNQFLRLQSGRRSPGENDLVSTDFQMTVGLKKNLFQYIWAADVFRSPCESLQRIYDDIQRKFTMSPGQTDLEDTLRCHPTEIVSAKFIQLVLSMAMVKPALVAVNFTYIRTLLQTERISMIETSSQNAYFFILNTLNQTYERLTGMTTMCDDDEATLTELQSYESLSEESKGVVAGLSALYMQAYRASGAERVKKLQVAVKSSPASWEWALYLAEALRMSRRDAVSRSKKPTNEELKLVESTIVLDGSNLFTRWNLIESVVDAIREFNGRFSCGELIKLCSTDEAMRFLRDECCKLCEDFPRNVTVRSIVSDYFARYVPFLYFDKNFSKLHLEAAYQLNSDNPETTHRLSILWRMNFRDHSESLKWLETTVKLDPSFFKGQFDYIKMVLGKPTRFENIGAKMEGLLKNQKVVGLWRQKETTDFTYYVGLAYFAEDKKFDTIRLWNEVIDVNESHFLLNEVDLDCTNFRWDTRHISADKIREWINENWISIRNGQAEPCVMNNREMFQKMFALMLGLSVPKCVDQSANAYFSNFQPRIEA